MKRPFIIQDFSSYFFILQKYELVYLFLRTSWAFPLEKRFLPLF